jgi:hypothetical protein
MALAELTEENKPNSLNCSNKTFFIHCYKFSHDYDLYIPVGGSLRVLRLLPPLKLVAMI